MAGAWLKGQTIQMRIADTTIVTTDYFNIPVYADSMLTGKNIMSYMLQLSFSASQFQAVSVITAGTLSAPFGAPAVNTSVPGQISIAAAGTSPLTGKGKFLIIRFKTLQPYTGAWINFTGIQNNYFNEGIPAMSFDNGVVWINPPPSITVSPDNATITKGEQQQFSISGGTAPYQWFVTNPGVATINSTGLLTGTNHGFTKVVAQDNNGLRDTTGFIDIRAMRLSIPTNLTQWQGADIDVPVNTTDLTGLNILSGDFSISFNQSVITPVSVVKTGTMLSSYPDPVINTSIPGKVSLSFAGTTALTGSGTLIYIRFHVTTIYAGSTWINFLNGLLNETFVPMFTNGYFTPITLPSLSISPNTGTLIAGQPQQFTLNGGPTPPVVWSVNNLSIASISQTGLVTAIKGGNLIVTAVDSHGATASTGNWLIYDTQVTMPDTSVCSTIQQFSYPVYIRALPAGEAVYSVQASFTYNSNLVTFLDVENTGTLSQGWTFVKNPTIGHVTIAGSGATPFSAAGIMVFLKFAMNPGFGTGSNASLTLNNLLLNEGIPNPSIDQNGSIYGSTSTLPGPAGTISGPVTVNQGQTGVSYSVPAISNATGYDWTLPSGAVITSGNNTSNIVVTFTYSAVSGAMRVRGTNPCGSGTVSPDLNITVVPVLPTNLVLTNVNIPNGQSQCYNATQTITVAGNSTTFTVQSGGSATLIAGQRINFLPGTRVYSGGYMRAYITTTANYCGANLPAFPSTVTGADELGLTKGKMLIRIYPNPNNGRFTMELSTDREPEEATLNIYGMMGNLVSQETLPRESRYQMDLSRHPQGIYFLRVTAGDRSETEKVVVW